MIGAMVSPIDLKQVIRRIPFKVEAKPGGGFIARAVDPTVQPIEAPTREELHQRILAAVSTEFPAFKVPDGKKTDVILQSNNGNDEFNFSNGGGENVATGPLGNLENRVLETLLDFAAKHVTPELAQRLAAQVGTASIQIKVNNKTALRVNSGPQGLAFGAPATSVLQNTAKASTSIDAGAGTIDGRPIVPEPSNFGKIVKLIVFALIVGAVTYLFLQYR